MKIVTINPNLPENHDLASKFYRLRDDVFAKKHHWEEPRGEERNRYDLASYFILVVKRGEVLAGCRVIHKDLLCGEPLPIEVKEEGEEGYPSSETVYVGQNSIEISRMINTTQNALVLWALHLKLYQYASGKFDGVFAVIRESYLISLQKVFRVKRLPIPTKEKGRHKFVPVLFTE